MDTVIDPVSRWGEIIHETYLEGARTTPVVGILIVMPRLFHFHAKPLRLNRFVNIRSLADFALAANHSSHRLAGFAHDATPTASRLIS